MVVNIKFFWFFLTVVLIDQVVKYLASVRGQVIINQGLALALFPQTSFFGALFFFVLGISLFLIFFSQLQIVKKKPKLATFLSVTILAGAVSNFLDKIIFTGVRDCWVLPVFKLQNNLADYYIVAGIAMLIITEFWLNHSTLIKIKSKQKEITN